jgi:hypothetical protein
VNRYVHSTKGTTIGPFTDPAKPARTIGAALAVAKDGDVIQIQDHGVFLEDELVIDKPLTLVGNDAPGDAPPAALPTIQAKGKAHRVIRIAGTPSTRAAFGPVAVRGVRIRGGHAVQAPDEPAQGAGGGIVVVDADNVTIERCVIEGNRTEAAPLGPWPEPDRVALRQAVVDLAGDIVSPALETKINVAITVANVALSAIKGTPPIPPFSRAAMLSDLAAAFDKKVPPGRDNAWLAGQAFGGGIGTVWASPTIKDCVIQNNSVEGRGGGIGVVGYGWPRIVHCTVQKNHTGAKGRRDGGGIGCEVTLPGKLPRDLSEIDLVRFLTAKVGAVRKALAAPSSISPIDLVYFAVWLADPTRPSPPLRTLDAIVFKGLLHQPDLLDALLYYLAAAALGSNAWDAWSPEEAKAAGASEVVITDSTISDNSCFDDGGGLYASVRSRVHLTKVTVTGNRAETGMGGGVRCSMGSHGVLEDCTIQRNASDERGGGLAGRNVNLTLTRTAITDNRCGDAPGGGFAYEAASEGDLAHIPNLWQAILVEVFGVRLTKVEIDGGCAITGNRAGYTASGAPLGAPKAAKGGGLFLVRGAFADVVPVELTVRKVARTVHGNTARTVRYPSKVVKGATIPAAHDVCIQDVPNHQEWTESNDAALISRGDLTFRS